MTRSAFLHRNLVLPTVLATSFSFACTSESDMGGNGSGDSNMDAGDVTDAADTNTTMNTDTTAGIDDVPGGGTFTSCEDLGATPSFVTDAALLQDFADFLIEISRSNETIVRSGCEKLRQADDSPPVHSTGNDWPSLGIPWTTALVFAFFVTDVSTNANNFAPGTSISPVDLDAAFPCGEGPNGLTLCSQNIPLSEGTYFFSVLVTEDDIPLADPTRSHQLGFVVDADGNAANDYQPGASYPADFFKDSDRWYQANYAPGSGWSMAVSNWNGSQAVGDASSMARIVLMGNLAVAIIPGTEVSNQSCPKHRMSTFTHLGDYGFDPPHDWSGDIEPPVAGGLESTCD